MTATEVKQMDFRVTATTSPPDLNPANSTVEATIDILPLPDSRSWMPLEPLPVWPFAPIDTAALSTWTVTNTGTFNGRDKVFAIANSDDGATQLVTNGDAGLRVHDRVLSDGTRLLFDPPLR